jgi:hypothetical protein
MRIQTWASGIALIREDGDRALSHEGDVTHHLRRLLNERDGRGCWVRCWPHKIGMTDSRQGLHAVGDKRGTLYWHANYAVEEAHKAFNTAGQVCYQTA